MNLYLISQSVNNDWDTYDSAVVAAESESDAMLIHPSDAADKDWYDGGDHWYETTLWCSLEEVCVELIGTATPGTERGVICASFNAG